MTVQLRDQVDLGEMPDFDPGAHNAVSFTHPDVIITGRVEYSLASAIGAGTSTFEISNPDPRIMKAIKAGGIIVVTGGYSNWESLGTEGYIDTPGPPDQTIFAGNVLTCLPKSQGENTTWVIEATTTPLHALNVCAALDTTAGFTYYEAIRSLMVLTSIHPEPISRASRSAKGEDPNITPNELWPKVPVEWTTSDHVMAEVEKLVQTLTYATGAPHVLIPKTDKPFQYDLANLFDAVYDRSSVHYDMEANAIYSHGPQPQFVEPKLDCADESTGEFTEKIIDDRLKVYFDYTITVPFDARIIPGSQVMIRNGHLGDGSIIALSVVHDMNGDSASSTVTGPFYGELKL